MFDWSFIDSHDLKSVCSALFGGFVGKIFRNDMTTKEFLFTAFSICGMALIFAKPIANYFGGVESVALVSALIGMFGVPICKMISENIPKIDLAGIIKSRFGG